MVLADPNVLLPHLPPLVSSGDPPTLGETQIDYIMSSFSIGRTPYKLSNLTHAFP